MTNSEQIIFDGSTDETRFDGRTVRRILERAAVEQHQLDTRLDDTYTLDELEEMAAEAGISRDALRAAIENRPSTRSRLMRWVWRLFPDRWSPLTRQLVFWLGIGAVLLGVMIAFPFVAKVLFWAVIIVLVMMALGISPF